MTKKVKTLRHGRLWADYYRDDKPQVNAGVIDGLGDIFTIQQLNALADMRRVRKLGRLLDWWESVRSKETDRDA